jgi:hypothetical protein
MISERGFLVKAPLKCHDVMDGCIATIVAYPAPHMASAGYGMQPGLLGWRYRGSRRAMTGVL